MSKNVIGKPHHFMAVAVSTLFSILLLTSCALAMDFGSVSSQDEFLELKEKIKQEVDDYNRAKGGTQWKAAFVYCVCAEDRSKIQYAYDMVLYKGSGGPVLARFRKTMDSSSCKGCYADPQLDFIMGEKEWANIKAQDKHWRKTFK